MHKDEGEVFNISLIVSGILNMDCNPDSHKFTHIKRFTEGDAQVRIQNEVCRSMWGLW